jgi:hypothetical protein
MLEHDLDKAQRIHDRIGKSFFGRLPLVRTTLHNRQIKLDAHRIRVEAAKKFLAHQSK